jgi:hypothetical protein
MEYPMESYGIPCGISYGILWNILWSILWNPVEYLMEYPMECPVEPCGISYEIFWNILWNILRESYEYPANPYGISCGLPYGTQDSIDYSIGFSTPRTSLHGSCPQSLQITQKLNPQHHPQRATGRIMSSESRDII